MATCATTTVRSTSWRPSRVLSEPIRPPPPQIRAPNPPPGGPSQCDPSPGRPCLVKSPGNSALSQAETPVSLWLLNVEGRCRQEPGTKLRVCRARTRGITDSRSRGPQVPRAGAAVVGSRAGKADGRRPGPGAGQLGTAAARGRGSEPYSPRARGWARGPCSPLWGSLPEGGRARRPGSAQSWERAASLCFHRWTPRLVSSFPWWGWGGRRAGSQGLGPAGPGPFPLDRHLEGGAACGAGGWWPSADCIRQTIIDPALVYPWCLISINSSWKELAEDTAVSPPPSSFALGFLWFVWNGRFMRIFKEDSHLSLGHGILRTEGTAKPFSFSCPYVGSRAGALGTRGRGGVTERCHRMGLGWPWEKLAGGRSGWDGIIPAADSRLLASPGRAVVISPVPCYNCITWLTLFPVFYPLQQTFPQVIQYFFNGCKIFNGLVVA